MKTLACLLINELDFGCTLHLIGQTSKKQLKVNGSNGRKRKKSVIFMHKTSYDHFI